MVAATGLSVSDGAPKQAGAADVQVAADRLRPSLAAARKDRGRPDRCPSRSQLGSSPRCIYGVRGADRTIVVYGDSKAMQYFPALRIVARRRGVRLVGLMRAGCPPMVVKYAYRCDRWRERNLRRLRRIDPDLVVTSSGVAYQVVADGERLSKRASAPLLRRAYARQLRALARRGAEVAVLLNPPRAPRDPLSCVRRNRDRLDRCVFDRGSWPYRNYVARAARQAEGAHRIDVSQRACPGAVCPAVIDDVLVLRDRVHFSATFVRMLAGWLDRKLPELGRAP